MFYKLEGNWRKGLAFDLHTVGSIYLGDDEHGHSHFDTTRSEMGELVYQLKYRGDKAGVSKIVALLDKIKGLENFDYIIPVPPTNKNRPYQPVALIAQALGERRGIKVLLGFMVNEGDKQLKEITDPVTRDELLRDALKITEKENIEGMKILLLDDLYRSGSTLKFATDLLYKVAKAESVSVLAMTKTRSTR